MKHSEKGESQKEETSESPAVERAEGEDMHMRIHDHVNMHGPDGHSHGHGFHKTVPVAGYKGPK